MESAKVMSAVGRIVSVGLLFAFATEAGVMDARRRGHSIIALASVLSRKGRYVSFENVAPSGMVGGLGAG